MTRCKTSREKPGTFPTFEPLKHSEENLSDQPLEVVLIELEPRPVDFKPAPITLDAVKLVDPEHHLVPLENDRVRVPRTILEPHLKSRMHEHPHHVVVCLNCTRP